MYTPYVFFLRIATMITSKVVRKRDRDNIVSDHAHHPAKYFLLKYHDMIQRSQSTY